MELTIEEFANRVGMTTRNIRQWQTDGLLPFPERSGRNGVYTHDHVSRIERVKELRSRGLPLDLIRRMLDSRPDDELESTLRHLAAGALAPFATGERVQMEASEIDHHLGGGASNLLVQKGFAAIAETGTYSIDEVTLGLIQGAQRSGVPVEAFTTALQTVREYQRLIAWVLVGVFREEVWQKFVDRGMPTQGWTAVAEAVDRVRELGLAAESHLFRRALDEVASAVLIQEGRLLRDQLPKRTS